MRTESVQNASRASLGTEIGTLDFNNSGTLTLQVLVQGNQGNGYDIVGDDVSYTLAPAVPPPIPTPEPSSLLLRGAANAYEETSANTPSAAPVGNLQQLRNTRQRAYFTQDGRIIRRDGPSTPTY